MGASMTTAVTTDAAPSRHRWLCIFLAVIAMIELVDALTSIQTIFTDYPADTAALRLAQTLGNIRLVLTPLIVAAALIFCAMGNARRAVLALVAFNLVVWLLDGVPAIALHGVTLSFGYGGLEDVFLYIITPIAALAGGALALKDRRLGLAGLLVSLSTLFRWIGVVIFIVVVAKYGF
jgi:hypothetical protein